MIRDWNGARREAATSPLRREVARNARVGVTLGMQMFDFFALGEITPPRTFGPTLPLKGRV
ncbi:hypothetical protein RRH01S_07_04430 [Rhizobium rhizogenes NBRC 13257]|jgi:hypothetical protein|uniref:Uncharacterized protein n=1 Tax=Rhizobium rhizogenes NBRC 13257 TaxID=1220581 RepID=A0AA87U5R7_RHIRH|nr:hypothetical protein A6U88_19035 [Agrobacterium sp. B131/95]GAJ94240.1 hypothetical protein RRH01S_07_04430 [Rhizobium rhizogenes NBRC 13257]